MKYLIDFMFLFIYVLGLFMIPTWRKRVGQKDWKFYESLWAASLYILYLIYLDFQQKTIYFLIPVVCFACFTFFYAREKRRLINGFLFNLFLASFMIYLAILGSTTRNLLLIITLGAFILIFLILTLFGIYALIIFLYWNTIVVLRKEGRSFANFLTLLLAIGLTIFLVVNHFSAAILPSWALPIFSILPTLLFYFSIVFYNFLTVSILYQFNRPKYNQDFIIVLGSGLIDGKKVPPLLGNRIQRGIQFYQTQSQKTLKVPKIIMSGGKGDDEHLAESVAMKEYAIKQGIPEKDILVEANSRNTLENMLFSKEIIQEQMGSDSSNVIFTTNSFHLFRAGLFAKKAQLQADGISSKTAFYFLPNAFLREFIAILVMYKRRHIIVCSLVTLFMLFMAVVELIIKYL